MAAALFLAVGCGGASSSSSGEWPTSLHDLERTAGSNDTHISAKNAPNLRLAWSFQTGGVIAATPTVAGDVAYFGSWDGYEYAVNATTGTLLWKTYLGVTHYNPICIPPVIGVSSPATVQDGVVYLGGGDSYWYALDAATGSILWKLYIGKSNAVVGNYNWAGPLVVAGYVYIGVASLGDCPLVQGKLLKVNLKTHRVANTLPIVPNGQLGGGIWTSPAFDPDTKTIYTTTGTKNVPTQHFAQAVLAVDPVTMAVKDHWELPNSKAALDADFGTSTTLFTDSKGRKLLATSNKNGFAYAFLLDDLSAGPVWTQEITRAGACPTCGAGSVSSGAFGDGRVYLAGGNGQINGQGYAGTVNALDPTTGRFEWQHGTSGLVIGALAYANKLVFVSAGQVFEVLDAKTGQVLYGYDTGSQMYSGPSLSNGYVYTANTAGKLFAFRVGDPIKVTGSGGACPKGSTCQDIGAVATQGSERLDNDVVTVSGSGGGLSGTADSFRLVSRPNTPDGNVQVVAEVRSLQATAPDAQAGVMLRQSNDPGAPFYSVVVKRGNRLLVQARTSMSGDAQIVALSSTLGKLPVFLMIQRTGNTIRAATSRDGKTYTLVPGSSLDLVLPVTSLVGLAASSSVNDKLGSAAFAGFTVSAPTIVPKSASDGSTCPSGWACRDVGNPKVVGGQARHNGTWTVTGGGADIWGSSDQFHLVTKQVTGSSTVSARVAEVPKGGSEAKSGVMFRQSGSPSAAYYAAYLAPSLKVQVQYRDVSGYNAQEIASTKGQTPMYLRVARSGSTFTTYTSTDGSTWSPVLTSSVSLPALRGKVLAGLAFTSHDIERNGSATFDQVTIGRGAPLPPDVCPGGWTCQDIGFPTPIGDQVRSGGKWTIYAGGGDIWDTYDQFRMVSRDLTGDGSLTVRVPSQSNTGVWAKAGPMFRSAGEPQSPYYAAFVTPGHGVAVQWRLEEAGPTGQITIKGTVPTYLRVVRKGETLTADMSSDGSQWTNVPGSTVTAATLAGTVLAGLAADSYNAAELNTSTFDNVVFTGGGKLTGIPEPWLATAVGSPTPRGSASYKNFVFTVKGGGIDIHGAVDQSEYVYQTATGDGELLARVTSQTKTDPLARAGLMFKASTASGAPYVAVMVTPGHSVRLQSSLNTDEAGTPYAFPNAWLKLTRDGSLFTAYQSSDGANWHQVGHVFLNLPVTSTIGMFVNAHNGGRSLGTATFDTVSFTPTGGGTLPAPWVSADIGQTGLPGNSAFSDGVYTVKGAGTDISAAHDEMQLAYRMLTGDGTIVANLTSLDNTDPFARAGVIIRASTKVGAKYALLAVTPGNGLRMEYGPNYVDLAGGGYLFPNAWLKLVRKGKAITTYRSSDGKKWTRVGSVTLDLPRTALIGLFVNAHRTGTKLAAAEFGSVAVKSP